MQRCPNCTELDRLRECENRQTAEQIKRARKAEQERDSVRVELTRALVSAQKQLESQQALTENAKKLWIYDEHGEIVTQGALSALIGEHDAWRKRAIDAEKSVETLSKSLRALNSLIEAENHQ